MSALLAPSEIAYLLGDHVLPPLDRASHDARSVAVLATDARVDAVDLAGLVTRAAILGLVRDRVLVLTPMPQAAPRLPPADATVDWGERADALQIGMVEATLLDTLDAATLPIPVPEWISSWTFNRRSHARHSRVLYYVVSGLLDRGLVQDVLTDTGAGRPLPVRQLADVGTAAVAAASGEALHDLLAHREAPRLGQLVAATVRTALAPPVEVDTEFWTDDWD